MNKTSLLAIEPKLVRKGQKLLHYQCSLWGADIRREQGNLLLQYGFERRRAPEEINGCSQYVLELGKHRRICLWGFGLYYGGSRGIYIGRYKFTPRLACFRDSIWTPEEIDGGPRLTNVFLLEQAVRWIAEYERWVTDAGGASYRQAKMHLAWESFADSLGDLRSLTAPAPMEALDLSKEYMEPLH